MLLNSNRVKYLAIANHFVFSAYFDKDTNTPRVIELCNEEADLKGYFEPITAKDVIVIGCFLVGNILHGAGGAVFYPIGFSILDAVFYDQQVLIGVWAASFAIGPALGYVIEGLLLTIDSNQFAFSQKLSIRSNVEEPESTDFSSAWWIGFVLSLGLCWALCALFIILDYFLKERGTKTDEDGPVVEPENNSSMRSLLLKLPSSVWGLMKKKTFILFNFSLATDGLVITSLATFLPKFIENQFYYSKSNASMAGDEILFSKF